MRNVGKSRFPFYLAGGQNSKLCLNLANFLNTAEN
jgi:hypothetical protein